MAAAAAAAAQTTMPWHCQLACLLARLLAQQRRQWRRQQCLGIVSSPACLHDGGGGGGADNDALALLASLLACSLACLCGCRGDDVDEDALALPACVLACARAAVVVARMMMPLHRLPFATRLLARQQQRQHWCERCLGIAGGTVTCLLVVLLSPPPPICAMRVVGSGGSRAPFGQWIGWKKFGQSDCIASQLHVGHLVHRWVFGLPSRAHQPLLLCLPLDACMGGCLRDESSGEWHVWCRKICR
jgi:hypothetical protein